MAKETNAKQSPTSATTYYYYYDDFLDEEAKGTKCPSSLYIQEGKIHSQRARYKQAMESFNTVLEREPKNIKALLARSKCLMHLMQYEQALKDVDDVLEENENCDEALLQKGEVEYVMGDFEYAYLTFLKGFRTRPAVQDFVFAMHKCRAAILNCIGPSSKFRVSENDVANVEKFMKETKSCASTPKKIVAKKPPKIDHEARKILGKAAIDKEFLQEILHGKGIQQGVCPESQLIPEIVQKGLDFLNGRKTFWQNVKPLYSREKVKSVLRVPLSKFRRAVKVSEDEYSHLPIGVRVQRILQDATEALSKKKFQDAIEICRSALDLMDTVSVDVLPYKVHLSAECLGLMGSAYLKSGDLESAVRCHKHKAKMAVENVMPDVFINSMITLYKDYVAAKEHRLAIQSLMNILPLNLEASKKAYILHEIGYTFLLMNDFKMARYHALQSLEYAEKLEDPKWRLQCCLLLGKTEVADCRHEKAFKYFENALSFATDSDTKDEIQNLLKELEEEDL